MSDNTSACCERSHCHTPKRVNMGWGINIDFNKGMRIIEKVSAIAMGIIAAMTDLKLFVPFFLVGCAIGFYQYATEPEHRRHGGITSSCSQGFIEGLTGVKLPPLVSLVANIAVTVCHIDHHSDVFVPVVGVSIGAWVGKSAAHYGELLCKKIRLIDFPKMATPRRAAFHLAV